MFIILQISFYYGFVDLCLAISLPNDKISDLELHLLLLYISWLPENLGIRFLPFLFSCDIEWSNLIVFWAKMLVFIGDH